jgi:3-methylcrotonyl-CoA carboxylase alpha subunit
MDYHLKTNGDTVTVSAEKTGENAYAVTIGGTVYHVDAMRLDNHHLHLRVDGNAENVFVSPNGSTKTIVFKGSCYTVEDMDNPAGGGKSRKKSTGIPDTVTPPMPAVVVAVLATPGDTVSKGQGLVVVSAMKMETTLTAPYDGIVKEIRTAVGEKVNPGDILVDVERMNTEEISE